MLSSRRMVPRHGEVWRLPPPPPHPPTSPSRPPLGHERGYTPAPCNLRSSQTEITHLRPVCECGVWVLWGEINFLKKQSSKCLATSFSIIGYCSSNKIGQPEWRVWIFLQVSCQWKENQSWVKTLCQWLRESTVECPLYFFVYSVLKWQGYSIFWRSKFLGLRETTCCPIMFFGAFLKKYHRRIIYNPLLFIRGLSYPRFVKTAVSLNFCIWRVLNGHYI